MSDDPVAMSEIEPGEHPPAKEDEVAEEQAAADVEEFEVEPPEKFELGHVKLRCEWLKLSEKNARKGSVRDQVASLREFGQHRPAVVQQSTRQVLIGNHMLMAARMLGWDELDCYVVDDDDDKALRRAIADNAVGDKAGWDEELLAEQLQETGVLPGFDEADVLKALKALEEEAEGSQVEPTYPLVPRLNEHYDYVMIFCETETDWMWLQTKFGLRQEKSYKSSAVALSHVITVERLQEILGDVPE